jgi:hypothetical protein
MINRTDRMLRKSAIASPTLCNVTRFHEKHAWHQVTKSHNGDADKKVLIPLKRRSWMIPTETRLKWEEEG